MTITWCCVECGGFISKFHALYGSGRCMTCYRNSVHKEGCKCCYCYKDGSNNPNWRGGGKVFYCNECGTSLRNGRKVRYHPTNTCLLCSKKHLKGENNPSCRPEVRAKISYLHTGSGNPAWRGGISTLPYSKEFTVSLRAIIRKRDNYICCGCGKTEENELFSIGRKLAIHHIDYNKKNSLELNLITVCTSCNIRANGDRDYWYVFYTYKIEEIYEKGSNNI